MENNVSTSLITGLITFILGTSYTLAAVNLPAASVGRAHEPKLFPLGLGALMIILSISLIGQELHKKGQKEKTNNSFKFDENMKNISLTVLNALVYSFLFAKAGYVISTFIFVGFELVLFSGKTRWKSCAVIALSFSLVIYILFSKMLGVYLPVTPFIWI